MSFQDQMNSQTQGQYQQGWEDAQRRFEAMQSALLEAGKAIVRYAEVSRRPGNPGELLGVSVGQLQNCATGVLQAIEQTSGRIKTDQLPIQTPSRPQTLVITGRTGGGSRSRRSRRDTPANWAPAFSTNGDQAPKQVRQAVRQALAGIANGT